MSPIAPATFSDALPTLLPASVEEPGLSARKASLDAGPGSLLADLDPGLLIGRDVAALRAEALFRLVCGGRPVAPTSAPASTGTSSPTTADGADSTDPAELGSADDLIVAARPATIIVGVDLVTLRRGTARPGELCEVEGQSTVPDRGVAYPLEIDQVIPLESGGDTRLDNPALLRRHNHRLKTDEGWTRERTGPTDGDPGRRRTPLPPFGQEPDLGLDPPEPVPRDCGPAGPHNGPTRWGSTTPPDPQPHRRDDGRPGGAAVPVLRTARIRAGRWPRPRSRCRPSCLPPGRRPP